MQRRGNFYMVRKRECCIHGEMRVTQVERGSEIGKVIGLRGCTASHL
jgi:hypothetical protein